MEPLWVEVTLWFVVSGMVALVITGLVMLGQYLRDYLRYRQRRALRRRH